MSNPYHGTLIVRSIRNLNKTYYLSQNRNQKFRSQPKVYIYIYIHIYLPTYLPTYLSIYLSIYIHAYIHTYIHTYIYIYIYMCIYMPLYLYIYIYIHIHTHTPVLFVFSALGESPGLGPAREQLPSLLEASAVDYRRALD